MIFSAPTLYTPIYHRYLSKLVLASFKYTTLSQHASRIFPKKCLPFLFENRSQISVNLESDRTNASAGSDFEKVYIKLVTMLSCIQDCFLIAVFAVFQASSFSLHEQIYSCNDVQSIGHRSTREAELAFLKLNISR